MYDVIVYTSTASAEEDQCTPICTCSAEKRMRRSTKKPNDKDGSEDNKMLCSAKLWKKLCLRCLASDPTVRKEWINLIFNEYPDRVIKNLVFCSLHFIRDSFKKCMIRRRIFRKIQCCADYIESDGHKCE